MLTQDAIDTVLAELSKLHEQISAAEFMSQAVEILRRRLGLHFAGLYLVDNLAIVLKSGSGGLGQLLLSYRHQFQLTDTSPVSRAIATGELWALETRYEEPNWLYRTYRSPLPARVRRNTKLSLHRMDEARRDWSVRGRPLHPSPPGWEICLPLRAGQPGLGALQIHAWDLSGVTKEKARWSPFLVDLSETTEPAQIVAGDMAALQRLADRLSTLIK